MATPAYVGELQQASQTQGGGISVAPGQPAAAPPVAPQQFLAELQTTVASGSASASTGQTTPPPATAQKTQVVAQTPPTQAPPPQTQYVTAEIQGSPTQSNAQSTPQYIVVTVTEGSLHSSDSVSDSSPPPTVVQTGVLTQVVQQVQSAQQRSVVQATSQTTKTEATQLSVTNLQSVHLTQETSYMEAERERNRERERELEQWLEYRAAAAAAAAAITDRCISMYADDLSHSGYTLDYTLEPGGTPYFPISIPVAAPPFTYSVPIMALGWEPEQPLYSAVSTVTAGTGQAFLFEAASSQAVGDFNQSRP